MLNGGVIRLEDREGCIAQVRLITLHRQGSVDDQGHVQRHQWRQTARAVARHGSDDSGRTIVDAYHTAEREGCRRDARDLDRVALVPDEWVAR